MRQFAKNFYDNHLKKEDQESKINLLNQLLTSNIHEHYKIASKILHRDKKLLYAIDWNTLFKWLSYAQGWEEVDQYIHMAVSFKFIKDTQTTPGFIETIKSKLIKLANSNNLANKRGALVILIRPLRKFKNDPKALASLQNLARKLLALPTYQGKYPSIVKKAVKWLERVVES